MTTTALDAGSSALPLPEPVAYRMRYRSEPGMIGHYPWTYLDQRRRKSDRAECDYEDLFTAEQLLEAVASDHVPTDTLCQRLQQQCSDWGVYWRAPDAHGVILTQEQALELLRTALGVEVEITSTQTIARDGGAAL